MIIANVGENSADPHPSHFASHPLPEEGEGTLSRKGKGERKEDRAPDYQRFFSSSCLRRSMRRILPLMVFGNSSVNSISRGYL